MHLAAKKGHYDVVQYLLSNGQMDVNCQVQPCSCLMTTTPYSLHSCPPLLQRILKGLQAMEDHVLCGRASHCLPCCFSLGVHWASLSPMRPMFKYHPSEASPNHLCPGYPPPFPGHLGFSHSLSLSAGHVCSVSSDLSHYCQSHSAILLVL